MLITPNKLYLIRNTPPLTVRTISSVSTTINGKLTTYWYCRCIDNEEDLLVHTEGFIKELD
jgi:hypothetical protein